MMQRVVVAAVAKAPTAVAAADPAAARPEPDDAVKDARSEAEPLPHVTQQHVPLDVSVHRLVQHGGGDVDAHPRVASLRQDVCRAGGREGGAAGSASCSSGWSRERRRSHSPPDSPLPQPMSRMNLLSPSGSFNSSMQRSAISVWTRIMRELCVYLPASLRWVGRWSASVAAAWRQSGTPTHMSVPASTPRRTSRHRRRPAARCAPVGSSRAVRCRSSQTVRSHVRTRHQQPSI